MSRGKLPGSSKCRTTPSLLLVCICVMLIVVCSGSLVQAAPHAITTVDTPPAGMIYHGVYPGSVNGEEDPINMEDVRQYEALSGQHVAWVYFSNNWYRDRRFPMQTAQAIRAHGSVPFIRLMLRSSAAIHVVEPLFTPQNIIDGLFDQDLIAWAEDARAFGSPILVEYGTECNGQWFAWNGAWNGAGMPDGFGDPTLPDGPERFVAAYRHIVQVMRGVGATNLLWVFHVNSEDNPDEAWNALENYYPGDDVVDWLAVSVYGAQAPRDGQPAQFRDEMDAVYPRLSELAPDKPIIVAEFGCTAGNPDVQPEEWAREALRDLFDQRWPKVVGFSWWNEHWQNDEIPQNDSNLRLQELPALADTFEMMLTSHAVNLQTTPLLTTRLVAKGTHEARKPRPHLARLAAIWNIPSAVWKWVSGLKAGW